MLVLQARGNRDTSPSQTRSDPRAAHDHTARLTIITDTAERPAPGGAASYGASRMGVSPHQQHATTLLTASSDAESLEEAMPSRSPSPAAAEQLPRSIPGAGQTGVNAVPAQVVSPTASRRVGMLRGGPVAGAYIDGRQVTTGSQELPAHIGYGFEPEDRFNRSAARKAEAVRYAAGLASNKAESPTARTGHASPPTRLIITSGARTPSGRDSPAVHAGSAELSRMRQAQHAEQPVTIVHAPVQPAHQEPEAERLQRPPSADQVHLAPGTMSTAVSMELASGRGTDRRSEQRSNQQPTSAVDRPTVQKAGLSESTQQDDMSRMVSSARVDSLSGWASSSAAQAQGSVPHGDAAEVKQQK